MKMPQLMPQAEAFLQQLAQGVDGRLHPYHARVIGEQGGAITSLANQLLRLR